MRRYLIFVLLVGVCFLFTNLAVAQEEESATRGYLKLKNALIEEGVTTEEVARMRKPLEEMLNKGATKSELEDAVVGLSKKGISGSELEESVKSMNELIKDGEGPKEAGNIVSQAAHQAKLEGLKGKDLSARVHEAIKQRKAEREQLKRKNREEKVEGKKQEAGATVRNKAKKEKGAVKKGKKY